MWLTYDGSKPISPASARLVSPRCSRQRRSWLAKSSEARCSGEVVTVAPRRARRPPVSHGDRSVAERNCAASPACGRRPGRALMISWRAYCTGCDHMSLGVVMAVALRPADAGLAPLLDALAGVRARLGE